MASEPLYRQIAEDLRRQIESAELAPGSQLPTEPELQDVYRASRNTVRDAIRLLITRGLVDTRAGQGTFVLAKVHPFVTTLTSDPRAGSTVADGLDPLPGPGSWVSSTDPVVEVRLADRAVAEALQVEPGSSVISRGQQRHIDNLPWALQTSFYPLELVQQGATQLLQAAALPGGTAAYLRRELGIRQAGYRDTITVRPPADPEMHFFRLPADGRVPVFEIRRISYDTSGTPIRLTVTVYPADRNQFVVNVGAVPASETAAGAADHQHARRKPGSSA